MDILNFVGNIFLEQSEFWWLGFLFIFGWVWTVKADNVDTYAAAHINDLQDCKVDTDEGPILQNILGGSQFGTWSQSDANKGIASVTVDSGSVRPTPGETVTGATSTATGKVMEMDNDGGNWGTGTGTGDIKLGAVTGTFQDNELLTGSIAGANFATVNGDLNIGIKNDPMNDDSVAAVWTDDGANITLTHVGALYTVVTALANQRAWIVAAPLTKGKIYKIEADIKDGTVAARHIEGYFNDGAAQYGRPEVTAAGWASVSWVFECATTTVAGLVGFRVVENMGGGGNNFEMRRFSCYEITPCCTAWDTVAWDGDEWTKERGLDLYREHWDGGTNTKGGSFYALKCVPDDINNYINWRYLLRLEEEHKAKFYGRTAIMGIWAKTSTPNHFRIGMYEGAPGTSVYSDYHPGDGDWHWLEVPITYLTNSGYIYNQWRFYQPPNIDGSTIVYISQPMLIFCPAVDGIIGEGNFQPKQQEWIYTDAYIPSLRYNNTTGWGNLAWTDLGLEADSDAMLPKGAKAIKVHAKALDSGSGALVDVHVHLRKNGTTGEDFSLCWGGRTNSVECHGSGMQPCNPDGDVEIELAASGGATLDIVEFRYMGVQVT